MTFPIRLAFAASALVASGSIAPATAQSLPSCPQTSSDTSFTGPTMQTDCTSSTAQGCTSKAGVTWDGVTAGLVLPGSAGNFQAPPGAAVPEGVYFGAAGDFDNDGWEDIFGADDTDRLFILRNQTITCGTTNCTPMATQTIPAAWWNTLTNVRRASFASLSTDASTPVRRNIKDAAGSGFRLSPMVAADFDGDGWTDVAVISLNYDGAYGSKPAWPTAARLFLNTRNCRTAADIPCGIGTLCTGQAANGACPATAKTGAFSESNLSCTNTAGTRCPKFMPTFATYDLRTGAAVSSNGASHTSPPTSFPGDFGPLDRPATNMQVVDWDGDGDLDIVYANSDGTCPGNLCSPAGKVFYPAIAVWKNDCNPFPATRTTNPWNAATKSCVGHIPKFSRNTTACGAGTCNNPDVLIPSTAHNNSNVRGDSYLDIDYDHHRAPVFMLVDIDKDNDLDLVLGSVGCCNSSSNARNRLRIFRGTSGSATVHTLDTTSPLSLSTSNGTYPGFEGSLTALFVHDFSGDGWPDMITASDAFAYSGAIGGRARYWRHTGNPTNPFGNNWPTCSSTPATCAGCSATCNPNPTNKLSESCGNGNCGYLTSLSPPQFGDFDWGLMLDYDHDPQRTKDIVITDGNTSSAFFVFPNRASPSTVAPCGSVASGLLPTPPAELTVSGACINPTATVPANAEIRYYLNNESPANWQLACTQTSTGFSPPLTGGQCCVNFPNITGRTIQWEARFDSNTTDGPGVCTAVGGSSPRLTNVAANYTYTTASQHYKAGVVMSDGVAYVGSFTQPGNRGALHALAAGLDQTYYNAASKLDAQSARNLYTTDLVGSGLSRIPFAPASPSATLIGRVGAASAAQATNVINWVMSPRFGINNSGIAPTKLGAIKGSTPAILNAPFRPNWYSFLPTAERGVYDAFAVAQSNRVPLVLYGSMDGVVHATITLPTAISDTRNGTEAWGFVPPYVASNMTSDYNASCTPSCAAGSLTVTSYPDGSPALLDFRKADDSIATAAIITDGSGGTSVTALDVTSTVSPSTFSVTGPTPLWSHQPGGAAAGKALSKPGIARTRIGGAEIYVVVAGSGINAADPAKGKVVAGFNLETGKLLWQFELACALTSDITVFDTDDSGEVGSPLVDGFADRAVFADTCGNVYKLNPGQDVDGDWIGNAGYGTIALGQANGKDRFALFATTQASALGEQRPIVGTIGARTDSTTDMVLFFGTGGLESYDPTKPNAFYAIYAKDGSIRNALAGTCAGGHCEKFYGGVVVTPEQVILQRSVDPALGTGTCDFGRSRVQAYSLSNPFALQFDVSEINGQQIAASSGPLYGDAGAIYFATVSGEIKRIGEPRAPAAGGDTAAGIGTGTGAEETVGSNAAFTLMGWRVVL